MERINQIEVLKGYEKIEKLSLGNSGDDKFVVEKKSIKYFVKFTKFNVNYDLKKVFDRVQVPCVKLLDIGKVKEWNYVVQEYFVGNSLKSKLCDMSQDEIYNKAHDLGKGFANLTKIYPNRETNEQEYEYFIKYLNLMMTTYDEANEKAQKMSGENLIYFYELKDYLLNNIEQLKKCDSVFGHPDIHPGNFLFNGDKLVAVDYETSGYANISVSILWGLLSDNILDMEKYLSFTSGYLNGLYSNDIPDNVIQGINLIFAFLTLRFVFKNLRKGEIEIAKNYLAHTKKYFNGKVELKERLTNKGKHSL